MVQHSMRFGIKRCAATGQANIRVINVRNCVQTVPNGRASLSRKEVFQMLTPWPEECSRLSRKLLNKSHNLLVGPRLNRR